MESVDERARRERRLWAAGFFASLVLHLLVLLAFRSPTPFPWTTAAAGPAAGDPKAAPGGGGLTALVLKLPQPIVVPPRPEFVVRPAPAEVKPLREVQLSLADDPLERAGEGEREGPETGKGLPGGEGGGDAGNDAEGLRRLESADPLHVLPPLGAPPEARGRRVTLHVFVTATGAVDSVRLERPTPSREYNERLVREAYEWTFKPAHRAGRPIASWYSYTVSIQ